MNIYEKLQVARVELQNKKLRKSGKNEFSKYDYYELSDFLPSINEIMAAKGMTSMVSFSDDLAVLTIVNTEKPEEKIQFTSPMRTATLKGCHEVQNLGAVETYERRYLYMNAFEIVEVDVLDKTHDKNRQPEVPKKADNDYVKRVLGLLTETSSVTFEGVGEWAKKHYGTSDIGALTEEQFATLYKTFEKYIQDCAE